METKTLLVHLRFELIVEVPKNADHEEIWQQIYEDLIDAAHDDVEDNNLIT